MPTALAILTRSPADPRLKTRIAPVVEGFEQRRSLVLGFLDDLVAQATAVPDVDLRFAVTPPVEGLRLARPWFEGRRILAQRGATFGDRLRNVFVDLAAAGFEHIVVLGADVPDLPDGTVREAVRLNSEYPDAVVTGPSGDGSFYLLAMTVHVGEVPDVFSGVRWGTPSMLDDVEAAARAEGRDVRRTREWHDVDTPEDVTALIERLRASPDSAPHTVEALKEIGLFDRPVA